MSNKLLTRELPLFMVEMTIAILSFAIGVNNLSSCSNHPLAPIFLVSYGIYAICISCTIATADLRHVQPFFLFKNIPVAVRPNIFSLLLFLIGVHAVTQHTRMSYDNKDCVVFVVLSSLVLLYSFIPLSVGLFQLIVSRKDE